jgi:hypothetical protein
MLGLRNTSRTIRIVTMILGAAVGYYVIFQMPAGGADNPLPLLVGECCFGAALGAFLLEAVLGLRKVVGRD